jgi:hypothetical protein
MFSLRKPYNCPEITKMPRSYASRFISTFEKCEHSGAAKVILSTF